MFTKLLLICSVFLSYSQAAWNVTCDLDLEGIANIIEFLPIECQEIYKSGPNSELYQSSLKESRNFAEFHKNLEENERKESSTPPNEMPKQNTTMRFDIYNRTMLYTCARDIGERTDLSTDSEKTKEYYSCLALKRDQMMSYINPEEDFLYGEMVN